MVGDITFEPLGVADLHLRSQEHPSMSGRVPDKCPDLSFSVLKIKRSNIMVGNITLKPLGVADLHLQCQKGFLISVQIYLFKL